MLAVALPDVALRLQYEQRLVLSKFCVYGHLGGETKTSNLWDFQPKTQTAVALADERPSTPSDIVNHRPDFE